MTQKIYKILYHLTWLSISLINSFILSMILSFEGFQEYFTYCFLGSFVFLEGIHTFFQFKKNFSRITKALFLNTLNFVLLSLLFVSAWFIYERLGAWVLANENKISKERHFMFYFFDNIFIFNFIIFIINYFFLTRTLLKKSI